MPIKARRIILAYQLWVFIDNCPCLILNSVLKASHVQIYSHQSALRNNPTPHMISSTSYCHLYTHIFKLPSLLHSFGIVLSYSPTQTRHIDEPHLCVPPPFPVLRIFAQHRPPSIRNTTSTLVSFESVDLPRYASFYS